MLTLSDLRAQAAGRVGTCALCEQQYAPGVQIVSLGAVNGNPAFAHMKPCMEQDLAAGAGNLGWDQAFKSMVPTKHGPTAWVKDDRVRLMVPYDAVAFDQLKAIPGRSYHADPKPHWSFPVERAAEVIDVAQSWPGFKVGPSLLKVSQARRSRDRIEVRGGRVELRVRFNEEGTDAIKTIPSARWDDEAWVFSLEQMDEVERTAREHWPRLQITSSFLRQRKLEAQAAASAGAHVSDQVIEYEGVGRLRGYQTEGVSFLKAREGRGILGDDMGLGKTIQVLAYCREIGVGEDLKAIVVCPASVRINWAREAAKWLELPPERIFVCGVRATRRRPSPFQLSRAPAPIPVGTSLLIINYDILKAWLTHIVAARFDLIAFDEAQNLKNSRSARSRMARLLSHGIRTMHDLGEWLPKDWKFTDQRPVFHGDEHSIELQRIGPNPDPDADDDTIVIEHTQPVVGNRYMKPARMQEALRAARKVDARVPDLDLSYPGIPRRIPTTGTPIENRPPDLWHLLHLVDPDTWSGKSGNYKAFTARYHGGYYDRFGRWKLGPRATNTEELNRRLMGQFLCRRRKTDVLKDLPAKSVHRVLLEPTSTELRPYHDLEDEIRSVREDYERQKARIKAALDEEQQAEIAIEARRLLGLALGKATQLRQTLGVCKVPAVVRWMQQLIDANEPLVVFAWHKDVQAALIEAMRAQKLVVRHVLAADSAMARVDAIDAFQAGDADGIVCSIKAAGAGITLHRSAHTLHVERDWNPGGNRQAEDRTHRIGQLRACFSWYLDVPGTFDDSMEQLCAEKDRDQQLILDGRAIPRDGSTFTQRALLANHIGLGAEDLEFLDGR